MSRPYNTKINICLFGCNYFNSFPIPGKIAEFHHAVFKSKERIVLTDANVASGMDNRTFLTDKNISGQNFFSAESLDSKVFRITVTSVNAAAAAFFMRHTN